MTLMIASSLPTRPRPVLVAPCRTLPELPHINRFIMIGLIFNRHRLLLHLRIARTHKDGRDDKVVTRLCVFFVAFSAGLAGHCNAGEHVHEEKKPYLFHR